MNKHRRQRVGGRREFLRCGAGFGAAGLAFGAAGTGWWSLPAATGSSKKMLVIFQRGGNDGINTVIPRGDAEYNPINRPTLFIPEKGAMDLGNGFAQLHPRMQPVMEIYDRKDLTGRPGPGNLAFLHRVGYAKPSYSHVESQGIWEEGGVRSGDLARGMFERFLPGRQAGPERGRGAGTVWERTPGLPRGSARWASDGPEERAAYPQSPFGTRLRQAASLLKRTATQIARVDLDGWDTHAGQGGVDGPHGDLLAELAQGFQALHRHFERGWNDLVIVTMTEFGRTSRENGYRGTDHAEATVMLVAGGGVRGGVYNCDAATWKSGDLFSRRGRRLARRTDFRAVFAEIFTRHFGERADRLSQMMPGFAEAAGDCPEEFAWLGLLG